MIIIEENKRLKDDLMCKQEKLVEMIEESYRKEEDCNFYML